MYPHQEYIISIACVCLNTSLCVCVCVAVRIGSSVCVCCICLAVASATLIRLFVHLPLAKLCNWLVFSFLMLSKRILLMTNTF